MAENEGKSDGRKRLGWRVFNAGYLRNPHDIFAGIFLALTGILLLYAFAMAVVMATRAAMLMFNGSADEIYKLLLAIGGIIGAPLVIWRVIIAHLGNHIAQETLYTTLLTKAVEQLGATREVKASKDITDKDGGTKSDTSSKTDPNIEVRLGGIYALEKLARDCEQLHWQIMEILCAYVRENAGPAKPRSNAVNAALMKTEEERSEDDKALLKIRMNEIRSPSVHVQAALTVIGRRSAARIKFENEQRGDHIIPANSRAWRLDLSECHLPNVQLEGLNFEHALLDGTCLELAYLNRAKLVGAKLDGAHLEAAWLNYTRLDGASLRKARLEFAWMDGANLTGADLDDAILVGASLRMGRLQRARFWNAQLQFTLLHGASLEGASLNHAHLEWAQLDGVLLDETQLYGTHFHNAWIGDAKCASARGFTEDQVASCWGNQETQLPEELTRPNNERWGDGSEHNLRADHFDRWRALRSRFLQQAM